MYFKSLKVLGLCFLHLGFYLFIYFFTQIQELWTIESTRSGKNTLELDINFFPSFKIRKPKWYGVQGKREL